MTDKLKTILILCAILIVGLVFTIGYCEIGSLKKQRDDANNRAAELDRLKSVFVDVQNANFELKERNSFLEDDNSALHITNRSVLKRLSDTKSELKSSVEAYSELKLENQRIAGRITQSGEIGGEWSADYDTVTAWYQFSATAYFMPTAYLLIKKLIVRDSTFAGIRVGEEGFPIGFIGHSNPFIKDYGAVFSLSNVPITYETSDFGIVVGAGPVYSSINKWSIAVLVGIQYKSWSLAPFVAHDNKGLFLIRKF